MGVAVAEEKAHAVLSASGAHRWMICTPSAEFETHFQDESSSYATEGTFAHAMAEIKLQVLSGKSTKRACTTALNAMKKDALYSQEMEDYIDGYVDVITERWNAARAKCPDSIILLEQRLDFSEWVPEGFGTGDVVIISEPMLEVIDLKYGKGVSVSALNNPQLRLYGLGAIDRYILLYDIERVRMTIIQPRLDNISTEELALDELTNWGFNEVHPRAALAEKGEGEFCAGEHCRFCKARIVCRARAEYNMQLTKHDFKPGPELIDDEIANILSKGDALVTWYNQVAEYALDQAVNHDKHWPGWKLVEGRSNRQYTNEGMAAQTLIKEGYDEDTIYEKKLHGITKLEKALGKKTFAEVLHDLVIKPQGKPKLAPESDPRPAFNSAAQAARDFKEEE